MSMRTDPNAAPRAPQEAPPDAWVPPLAYASTRVDALAGRAVVAPVARILRDRREQILRRWLSATGLQPFARGLSERSVSDHIPVLVDSLIALLERQSPGQTGPRLPSTTNRSSPPPRRTPASASS